MPKINSQEIVRDIEFEIAQGILSTKGLSQAIQSLQQFQIKLRMETFDQAKMETRQREVFSRMFQLNEMVLSVLQEIALQLQTLQLSIQNVNRSLPEIKATQGDSPEILQLATSGSSELHIELPYDSSNSQTGSEIGVRSREEIEKVMGEEAIHIEMQARPIHIPLIGWLLTRLRIFYQRPAYFYSQLIEHRQAPVNRVLGDRILYLENMIQTQQSQIDLLQTEIKGLKRQSAGRAVSGNEDQTS